MELAVCSKVSSSFAKQHIVYALAGVIFKETMLSKGILANDQSPTLRPFPPIREEMKSTSKDMDGNPNK